MTVESPAMPEAEDYRVKNAREGKAIYIPGKSVNETRAKMGLPPLDEGPVVAPSDLIFHTREELSQIEDEVNEVQYVMGTLARTLETLRRGISAGSINESDLEALLQLAGSYAKNASDKECNSLIMKIMRLERTLTESSK